MYVPRGVAPLPEHIALSFVGPRIVVVGMLFKRELTALLARAQVVIGHKQVVVVAVTGRHIPVIGPDPHPASCIAHKRVVEHHIVVRRLDEHAEAVVDTTRHIPPPGEDVVSDDGPVGRPLQEEVGSHVVVKPALLDHVVKVVHVQPQPRAFVVGEVEPAEGGVGRVEPLTPTGFPHRDVAFPVVVLAL